MIIMIMMMSSIPFSLISEWLSIKRIWKVLDKKKNIDLCYVDYFDYKFTVITKVDFFEDIMDTTHVDKKKFQVYKSLFQNSIKDK
jgi:hypothetical protein